jgi:hypothetical protein
VAINVEIQGLHIKGKHYADTAKKVRFELEALVRTLRSGSRSLRGAVTTAKQLSQGEVSLRTTEAKQESCRESLETSGPGGKLSPDQEQQMCVTSDKMYSEGT